MEYYSFVNLHQQHGAVPGFDSVDCCGYKHAVRCVISTLI
jgi:hypothetical protein